MSYEAKKEYIKAIYQRYQKSTKKQKGLILNEACQICQMSRKHLIRILNGQARLRTKRAGRKKIYGQQVTLHIHRLWLAMGMICSKKMKIAIPLWLPYDKEPTLTKPLKAQVLKMSSSTIDRLLKPYREQLNKGLSATKKSLFLRSIPIELLHSKIKEPGYIEADTVAHCGNSLQGQFISSLTMTDLYSGWTQNRACWGKTSHEVLK